MFLASSVNTPIQNNWFHKICVCTSSVDLPQSITRLAGNGVCGHNRESSLDADKRLLSETTEAGQKLDILDDAKCFHLKRASFFSFWKQWANISKYFLLTFWCLVSWQGQKWAIKLDVEKERNRKLESRSSTRARETICLFFARYLKLGSPLNSPCLMFHSSVKIGRLALQVTLELRWNTCVFSFRLKLFVFHFGVTRSLWCFLFWNESCTKERFVFCFQDISALHMQVEREEQEE